MLYTFVISKVKIKYKNFDDTFDIRFLIENEILFRILFHKYYYNKRTFFF